MAPHDPREEPATLTASITDPNIALDDVVVDFYYNGFNASAQPNKTIILQCHNATDCGAEVNPWYSAGLHMPLVRASYLNSSRHLGSGEALIFIPAAVIEVQLSGPTYAAVNGTVLFNSTTQPAEILTGAITYVYAFGDGFTTTTTASQLSHAYTKPGTFSPGVQASNNFSSAIDNRKITVLVPLGNISIAIAGSGDHKSQHDRAGAAAAPPPPEVRAGEAVNFVVHGLPSLATAAYELSWDFGDGSPPVLSTNTEVEHDFAEVGWCTVQLQASNPVSQSAATLMVEVLPGRRKKASVGVTVVLPLMLVGLATAAVVFFTVRAHRRRRIVHEVEVADHDFGMLLPSSTRPVKRSGRGYGTVEMFDL